MTGQNQDFTILCDDVEEYRRRLNRTIDQIVGDLVKLRTNGFSFDFLIISYGRMEDSVTLGANSAFVGNPDLIDSGMDILRDRVDAYRGTHFANLN